MDRRTFLQTMIAMPFLAVGNKILGANKMSVPSGQELSEIIAKSIEQGSMSDFDKDQLELYLSPMDTVRGWLKQGSNHPSFNNMNVENSNFSFMPNDGARFRGTAATIANDTDTNIVWDAGNSQSTGSFARIDPLNTDRILVAPPTSGRIYMFSGVVQFDPNATGTREVGGQQRDIDGNGLGGYTLAKVIADEVLVLSRGTKLVSGLHHLTFGVRQKSGGDLDMVFSEITIFRVL